MADTGKKEIRLQKFLSDSGVGSRRRCEQWIRDGLVVVNGAKVTEMGTKVNPDADEVLFDGQPVKARSADVYIVLNKPVGYITSSDDQFGRETVLDLVSDLGDVRVFPVGRLDYHSSGLLILTNDGDFAYKLTHPKFHIEKTYRVSVAGEISDSALESLSRGIDLDGVLTSPAEVKLLSRNADTSLIEITIHEGRNRQVRRMCQGVGHDVDTLSRIRVGSLTLGGLKPGEYRFLTDEEVAGLLTFKE